MKTLLLIACALLLGARHAGAHIGSPDVFAQGKAGPYEVHVVVRPPRSLPGIAQVSVRLESDDPAKVSLRAVFGDAVAPWLDAPPTPANPHLHTAEPWLLRRGLYRLEVSVAGDAGRGETIVPLNIAPLQQPSMPIALGILLSTLGLLLFGGAIWLARKIARDISLEPGTDPTTQDRARGRRAAVVATLVVLAVVLFGAWRWRTMDRLFRESIVDQPTPVDTETASVGDLQFLRILASPKAGPPGWDSLVTDHGKLVHLFLVRSQGDAFAHLHPVRRSGSSFETLLPPLPSGDYNVYGEITNATGASRTLISRATLPEIRGAPSQAASTALDDILCQTTSMPVGNSSQPATLDADAAWTLQVPQPQPGAQAQISRLHDGVVAVFENAGALVENQEIAMRFSFVGADGERIPLRPYMGMAGHAVVRHIEGTVFAHLHPLGTISMAAQQLFTAPDTSPIDPSPALSTAPIVFPYAFPRPGDYLVWIQARTPTRILTGAFQISVAPAPVTNPK